MTSIEMPFQNWSRSIIPRNADGSFLKLNGDAILKINIERVFHPQLTEAQKSETDTLECLQVDHRVTDGSGAQFVFTSYVPSRWLWERLYVSEAYLDCEEMLRRKIWGEDRGPWQQVPIV